jgi:hypothetical protein
MSKISLLFSPLFVGEGPGVRSKMTRTFFNQKSSDFSPRGKGADKLSESAVLKYPGVKMFKYLSDSFT